MGGDGTWTPFHEDVYRSYSWSANICGQKLWRLVAPNQEHLFTDSLGNTIYDLRNYDPAEFPRFTSAVQYEVVQNPGECLFVPSGWWHQVVNIGHCISINHNWANAYNLHHLVDRLQRDYRRVVHALRDVADMDGFAQHCQLVLRADSGIDHLMFVQFLAHMRRVYVGCSEDQPPPMLAAHPSSVALRQTDPHFWSKGEVGVALDRIRQAFLRLRDHDPATRSDPSLCQLIDNELRELDMWESKVQ
ncbi:hypothetical protein EV182_004777 [Spiromyces aspiralis]|uniref:Uncharacterized protein n=1 Tax=Spiromyces aspiralis TaxID=68401 RepID=A0ACC1HEK6_9FUNG|nr:hypothetical protein EV182_004777 [Spiromyces aspiralis]